MQKDFVPYEPALELKELGFDEPCFGFYGGPKTKHEGLIWYEMPNRGQETIPVGDVLAPTFSQTFRWFRENHKLLCLPEPTGSWRYSCHYRGEDKDGKHWVGYLRDKENKIIFYDSYEEAELACLKKLIEIVKNKQS